MPILETITTITPASLVVIFVVLPISLVAFYMVPVQVRIPILGILSILFVGLLNPIWMLFLLASIVLTYLFVYLMGQCQKKRTKSIFFTATIFINFGVFVFAGAYAKLTDTPMLLGGMVVPFIEIAFASDCYTRATAVTKTFWEYLLEVAFFPRLYAGPFKTFGAKDFNSVRSAELSLDRFARGISKFIQGGAKAVILGKPLWQLYQQIRSFTPVETSLLSSWVYVLVFALALYFIVSGYCDMAVGIGHLFGIELPESFRHPYQSRTITNFVGRFHKTWVKYVVSTVEAARSSREESSFWDAVALFISAMIIGIWFGFTFNYAIWGAYFAAFLLLEKYVYPKLLKKIPVLLGRVYTMLVLLISFPIATEMRVSDSLTLYKHLFLFGNKNVSIVNNKILYLLSSHWLLLALSIIGCTSLVSLLGYWIKRKAPVVAQIGLLVLHIGLFAVLVVMLVY